MRFKAQYISAVQPEYWRTVWADNVNEATVTGKRYARKGYKMIFIGSDC